MLTFIARHTSLLIIISILLCILVGTGLFLLPGVITTGCSFADALFLSASSFCCVGVLPIPFASLTIWGKIILLILIQIGGIGVLTLFMLFLRLFSQVGVGWYTIAKDFYDVIERRFFKRFFLISLIYMLAAECIGALLFYYYIMKEKSFFDAFFYAADCFCNAGFFASNPLLMNYNHHHLFYLIGTIMMMLGGMGFLFAFEIINNFFLRNNDIPYPFSFTIKFGYYVYLSTVFIAWTLFFLHCSPEYSLLELCKSLFASISFRACGVNPYLHYTPLFIFLTSAYSLCGTLPFATGGGLKSSIVGIFFVTFYSLITNVKNIIIFGKQILPIYLLQAHLYIIYLFISSVIAGLIIQNISGYIYDFGILTCYILSLFTATGIAWLNSIVFTSSIKFILTMAIFIGKIGALLLHVRLFTPSRSTNVVQKPEAKIIMF